MCKLVEHQSLSNWAGLNYVGRAKACQLTLGSAAHCTVHVHSRRTWSAQSRCAAGARSATCRRTRVFSLAPLRPHAAGSNPAHPRIRPPHRPNTGQARLWQQARQRVTRLCSVAQLRAKAGLHSGEGPLDPHITVVRGMAVRGRKSALCALLCMLKNHSMAHSSASTTAGRRKSFWRCAVVTSCAPMHFPLQHEKGLGDSSFDRLRRWCAMYYRDGRHQLYDLVGQTHCDLLCALHCMQLEVLQQEACRAWYKRAKAITKLLTAGFPTWPSQRTRVTPRLHHVLHLARRRGCTPMKKTRSAYARRRRTAQLEGGKVILRLCSSVRAQIAWTCTGRTAEKRCS